MATTIGNEPRYDSMISHLVQMEHDALAVYDSCLKRLDDAQARRDVEGFRDDHAKRLEELRGLARESGIGLIEAPDMRGTVSRAGLAFADLTSSGDRGLFDAMKRHEDDAVSAYSRAAEHEQAPEAARQVFSRAVDTERRHREYMESAAARSG
jgi:rubrerythrin